MKAYKLDELLYGSVTVLALFIVQVIVGKAGGFVANSISYRQFDPYNAYAWISVHHIIQMIIALAIIAVLSKLLKIDFGFELGDTRKGTKYLAVYTAAFTVVTLITHILMYISNQLPTYDFPLNKSNIIGTLGFQLFLSGPSEEILFRALPITVLVHVFGGRVYIRRHITLEVIIMSFLFSIAHMEWSLFPFSVDANVFRLFYAFVLGAIQGVAYQETHSILYPMLTHSLSNVLMVGTGYLFIFFSRLHSICF
jgi:membrane protease YdiL (CAAX protease family)